MTKVRLLILALVLITIGGAIFYLEKQKPKRVKTEEIVIPESKTVPQGEVAAEEPKMPIKEMPDKSSLYPRAKEVTTPDGFINVEKISVGELVGKKVVLIDFWTYSCINCQRTTPYLNAWYEKYKDKGLEIIGVHTPELHNLRYILDSMKP